MGNFIIRSPDQKTFNLLFRPPEIRSPELLFKRSETNKYFRNYKQIGIVSGTLLISGLKLVFNLVQLKM
jgi:hypothetical protein